MIKKHILLLLSLCLLSTSAHALIGGVHPARGTYPSSVFMSTLGYNFCTGVVVGKRMVLTAAHCVTGWVRYKLEVGGRMDLFNNTVEDRWDAPEGEIKAVYLHPAWPVDLNIEDDASARKYKMMNRDLSKIVDLAMIEFNEDLGLPVATLDFKALPKGEVVTMGGFGCRNDKQEGAGHLFVALKKVNKVVKNDFVTTSANANDQKTSFLCSGDSGGPVYRGTSQKVVVGINSQSSQFWIFKGGNYAVRLDLPGMQTWIKSVFAGKAKTMPIKSFY